MCLCDLFIFYCSFIIFPLPFHFNIFVFCFQQYPRYPKRKLSACCYYIIFLIFSSFFKQGYMYRCNGDKEKRREWPRTRIICMIMMTRLIFACCHRRFSSCACRSWCALICLCHCADEISFNLRTHGAGASAVHFRKKASLLKAQTALTNIYIAAHWLNWRDETFSSFLL